MSEGTIVFVHGTGVRLADYQSGFERAKKAARETELKEELKECYWGTAAGSVFTGESLPDPPEDDELPQWQWLFDDPLRELDALTIRDQSQAAGPGMPGVKPQWLLLWETIAAYKPSDELKALLERSGLTDLWPKAWTEITSSPLARDAFEASSHELAVASHALARAVIAQLHVMAVASGQPGLPRWLRDGMLERLKLDWKQEVFGIGDFLVNRLLRIMTPVVRKRRAALSERMAAVIGDILLYQAHAPGIQAIILKTINTSPPPVTVLAHSLGGIASVDLLVQDAAARQKVSRLVTAGSQAPLLYEMDALVSLKRPQQPPADFPRWLNLFDRDDFLSYVAHPLFPAARDFEVRSGLPFPASHSGYFTDPAAWQAIAALPHR